jgi:hypothetical protein
MPTRWAPNGFEPLPPPRFSTVVAWLDNSTVAKRTRDRILDHVTDVPGGYGRKGSINADQMAAITALEPEIVKQMREILMAAKDRV